MSYAKLALPEFLLFAPKAIEDECGPNFESFSKLEFVEVVGLNNSLVQDNHSESVKGVLRGFTISCHRMLKVSWCGW
jgi:dTDP-4-dehydrorhamnose 3,5-epimerase